MNRIINNVEYTFAFKHIFNVCIACHLYTCYQFSFARTVALPLWNIAISSFKKYCTQGRCIMLITFGCIPYTNFIRTFCYIFLFC